MAWLYERRVPSIQALMEIKDVTKEDAIKCREIWQTVSNRREAREQIDGLIRTCGVECLGIHKRSGQAVYYCNAGDTYSTTIIFNGLRMYVGCIGDLMEKNAIREFEQP